MRRQPSLQVFVGCLFATAVTAACSSASIVDGTAQPSSRESISPASASPRSSTVELPAGFPVLPGAVRDPLPADDPRLIARWSSDQVGPVAYDFYVDALPAAGYRTIGLFPGGAVAVILFQTPTGERWELALTLEEGGTRIEVRTGHPQP